MSVELVLHAVQSVLTLFILGGAGYVLARAGWFSADSKALLPRLVTLVALPPYMIYNITGSMTRQELLDMFYGSAVPFISIFSVFGLSLFLARLIKPKPGRRGIFCTSFAASNTVFIGLPVNVALFGSEALPYVLLYYFANTLFFWTVGNYMLAADGKGPKPAIVSLSSLKQVFSPPLLGLFTGVGLVLAGLKLPPFLNSAAMHLGSLTTPLALMIIGITLQSMKLRQIKLDRDLLLIFFGRFILSPLSIILLSRLFPMPELMFKVFVMQASLPVVVSVGLLSSYYKSDVEFGTVAVSATTLAAMLTIPVYMLIVTFLV